MRPESPGEKRADAVVHLTGVVGAFAAVIGLLSAVVGTSDAHAIAAAMVYSIGLLTMLSISAAYNLSQSPVRKAIYRRYDHAAIFVMIAGTYTPFVVVLLDGPLAYVLLALMWGFALIGAAFKLVFPGRLETVSVVLYLALGWSGFPVVVDSAPELSGDVLLFLTLGAVLYTVGVGFHFWETLTYQNAIWHVFVLAAAGCHFVAVYKLIVV